MATADVGTMWRSPAARSSAFTFSRNPHARTRLNSGGDAHLSRFQHRALPCIRAGRSSAAGATAVPTFWQNANWPPARCTCPEPWVADHAGPPISLAPLQRNIVRTIDQRLVVNPLDCPCKRKTQRISYLRIEVANAAAPVPLPSRADPQDVAKAQPPHRRPVVVVLQSKPLKSKPGVVRPADGPAPRAAASARLSEY